MWLVITILFEGDGNSFKEFKYYQLFQYFAHLAMKVCFREKF